MGKAIILLFCICVNAVNVFGVSEDNLGTDNIQPYASITDLINGTIEDVKSQLPDEPLVIPLELGLPLNDSLLTGVINIANSSIGGLKGLLVPYLNVGGLTSIKFEFVVPTLEIDAAYNASVVILSLLPVDGQGTAKITVNNVLLKGHTALNGTSFQFYDTYIEIYVENIQVNIGGLLGDDNFSSFASGLITTLINMVVDSLNDTAATTAEAISPIIEDILNDLISAIIGGGSKLNTSPELQELLISYKDTLSKKFESVDKKP